MTTNQMKNSRHYSSEIVKKKWYIYALNGTLWMSVDLALICFNASTDGKYYHL